MPNILEQIFRRNIGRIIEYDGQTIYPYDKLKVSNGNVLRLKFIGKESAIPEGIIMKVDKKLVIDDGKFKSIAFWYDGAEKYVDINVVTKNGELRLYNAWRDNDGRLYAACGNNAIKVEKINQRTRRYSCNYGFDGVDFSGMVFEIELLNGEKLDSLMD